jgi:hypothetical protein
MWLAGCKTLDDLLLSPEWYAFPPAPPKADVACEVNGELVQRVIPNDTHVEKLKEDTKQQSRKKDPKRRNRRSRSKKGKGRDVVT